MIYNFKFRTSLRALLTNNITENEFNDLVYSYFPNVYTQFTIGQNKKQRVRTLIEYADTHQEIKQLLEGIKKINPKVYQEYKSKLEENSPPPPPPPSIICEYDIAVTHISDIVFYGYYSENLIGLDKKDTPIGLKQYIDQWVKTEDEDNPYYLVVVELFETTLNAYIKHFELINIGNECYIDMMRDVLKIFRYMLIRNHCPAYQSLMILDKLHNTMITRLGDNWNPSDFVR